MSEGVNGPTEILKLRGGQHRTADIVPKAVDGRLMTQFCHYHSRLQIGPMAPDRKLRGVAWNLFLRVLENPASEPKSVAIAVSVTAISVLCPLAILKIFFINIINGVVNPAA